MINAYINSFIIGLFLMVFAWLTLFNHDFWSTFGHRLGVALVLTIPYLTLPVFIWGAWVLVPTLYWSTAVLLVIGLFVLHGLITVLCVAPHAQK